MGLKGVKLRFKYFMKANNKCPLKLGFGQVYMGCYRVRLIGLGLGVNLGRRVRARV